MEREVGRDVEVGDVEFGDGVGRDFRVYENKGSSENGENDEDEEEEAAAAPAQTAATASFAAARASFVTGGGSVVGRLPEAGLAAELGENRVAGIWIFFLAHAILVGRERGRICGYLLWVLGIFEGVSVEKKWKVLKVVWFGGKGEILEWLILEGRLILLLV